jgi:hypothetical protein
MSAWQDCLAGLPAPRCEAANQRPSSKVLESGVGKIFSKIASLLSNALF